MVTCMSGKGPDVMQLYAAFLWHFNLSLFPQINWWRGRCAPILHWEQSPLGAGAASGCLDSTEGHGKGQKPQRTQRLGQLARAERCLCAAQRAIVLAVVLPGVLVPSQALALCWGQEHSFVRRRLNSQPAAAPWQAESTRTAPGKPLAPMPRI